MIATFVIKMDVGKIAAKEHQTTDQIIDTYTDYFTQLTGDEDEKGISIWLDDVFTEKEIKKEEV